MKRWITVGAIWAGALFLTYWNGEIIDRMNEVAEKEEILSLERRFLETQSDNIPEVLEEVERLRQPVEAPRIGLLSLEREFQHLAAGSGLTGMQMKNEPGRSAENCIPVTVSFRGFLRGAVEWLTAIRKEYPHMVVKRVEVVRDPSMKEAIFEIYLDYRFQIVSCEKTI